MNQSSAYQEFFDPCSNLGFVLRNQGIIVTALLGSAMLEEHELLRRGRFYLAVTWTAFRPLNSRITSSTQSLELDRGL